MKNLLSFLLTGFVTLSSLVVIAETPSQVSSKSEYIQSTKSDRIVFLIIASLFGFVLAGCTGNVIESYQREFSLDIPNPATGPWPLGFIFKRNCTEDDFEYREDLGVVVGTVKEGAGHWTTTAYLPTGVVGERLLYVMYLNLWGTELQETYQEHTKIEWLITPIPAGTFSVLTVVLTYPETTDDNTISYLINAHDEINQLHATFASDRGYFSPLVQFDFTNETVDGSRLSITKTTPERTVIQALRREHIHMGGDYDFLVVLNLDPELLEGGISYPGSERPYYIYMDKYNSEWALPLNQDAITSIAKTAYNHEISHYWGWNHDWTCAYDGPFKAPPVLFGWTDTDGDGVPEIIDPTPYGTAP